MVDEEWIEIPIKDLLPSKKAQRNYKKFFNDLNKAQKKDMENNKLIIQGK